MISTLPKICSLFGSIVGNIRKMVCLTGVVQKENLKFLPASNPTHFSHIFTYYSLTDYAEVLFKSDCV